jgi:two-component system, cell cycle response regulator
MERSHGALARALLVGVFVAVAAATAATAVLSGSIAWTLAVFASGLVGVLTTMLAVGASGASRGDMLPAIRAHIDPITGLSREDILHREISTAISGQESGPMTLYRFSLEGFRSYNDAFGETCGDALLAWLARKLRDAAGVDEALYRTRGAGFAALAPGPPEASAGLRRRCQDALEEIGEGFRVSCVVGATTLPAEARTAQAALELAGRRAHELRRADREKPGLRRAAEPASIAKLGSSSVHVGEAAGALGRALGVPEEQLGDLEAAVQLRDVGNLAVPESVFTRSGELPGHEWRFIELHTLVGERLLSASSGLESVARLVRSSHERFDGSGYPDGLAGEQIPIGSRIAFVCSAFEDMTAERAHRPALSVEVALSELERGAGTQFDPIVVRAFRAHMASALQRAELAPPADGAPATTAPV